MVKRFSEAKHINTSLVFILHLNIVDDILDACDSNFPLPNVSSTCVAKSPFKSQGVK